MFGSKKQVDLHKQASSAGDASMLVYAPEAGLSSDALEQALAPVAVSLGRADKINAKTLSNARTVLAIYQPFDVLDQLCEQVIRAREERGDGTPVLIIGVAPGQLTGFGGWLHNKAKSGGMSGVRLSLSSDPLEIVREAVDKSAPIPMNHTNVIAMPTSTEVDTADYKYFYCISPELRELLAYLDDLATNNISRIYLLGGPGAGKTSLAYYFYLARKRGNFVTCNLTSESTDNKAAMKSLLCGHVSGAFPGAGSRTGAFAHARDGVCFLDESHGVSGSVMEVLMEALDSGQYLPYGASAKQPLNCAVVFASNRNWETLIGSINIDEHARLGAMIMHLADLSVRQEDLIAVLAATLHRMRKQSVTWTPPVGITDDAWEAMKACPWKGNTRALMRVAETSYVDCATQGGTHITAEQVKRAMGLWEPSEHASHAIYTSAGSNEDPLAHPTV